MDIEIIVLGKKKRFNLYFKPFNTIENLKHGFYMQLKTSINIEFFIFKLIINISSALLLALVISFKFVSNKVHVHFFIQKPMSKQNLKLKPCLQRCVNPFSCLFLDNLDDPYQEYILTF